MTKCDYFPNLTLHTEEKQMKELPIILQLFETCPSGWMPKCLYSGQYGTVKLPQSMDIQLYLQGKKKFSVSRKETPSEKKFVRLIDSRVPKEGEKKHKLGVCVFPVVLMAEWTILARFFEGWIEHGATKFYLPIQSISREFDGMLRMYERDPSIDIERIDWSILPYDGTSFEEDPNAQVMRAEVR
ncbi:unnamed protein product, partial [Enterobius vermicularis]|uniref:Glycosyltransferase family 92 protein n=1 Tax=Enterobius vermicularis TaxID=51028 RepID=A0A0N4VR85_ENTVE